MQSNFKYFLSLFLLIGIGTTTVVYGQYPVKATSGDIHEAIKKLNVLGTALYVAAHPDDENTRLISYLSNEKKLQTAYLSLTRGDGGQNLIGPEIGNLLGVIRTQELLAARAIDGGMQFFSRANDFGYSKNPYETFNIWDKDKVMEDVIWTIRKLKPDVIINRFKEDPNTRTHGHHTASAMLAYEAFDMTNDKSVYPDQLNYVDPWQPTRLYFNTSWFFYGSREKFAEADKSDMQTVDVGVYYPIKGKSNTEIAAESRSMHKCQAFGSTGTRGSSIEYLQHLKGVQVGLDDDIFEGIDVSWNRVQGGSKIGDLISMIDERFKHDDPGASVPNLLMARRMIASLEDGHWKRIKLSEIDKVIGWCMGLYLEASTRQRTAVPGEKLDLRIEVSNRSDVRFKVKTIHFMPTQKDTTLNTVVANNNTLVFSDSFEVPADIPYNSMYWLNEKAELGMYHVPDPLLRGLPESPRYLKLLFECEIEGIPILLSRDVVFKMNDREAGEVFKPFDIVPELSLSFQDNVHLFASDAPKSVRVSVRSNVDDLKAELSLEIPEDWKVEPAIQSVEIALKGDEKEIEFQLFPPSTQSNIELGVLAKTAVKSYSDEHTEIVYDHIPLQNIVTKAKAKAVRINIKTMGNRIAYIDGTGDLIPESLGQIGYQVERIPESSISAANLLKYDAVIVGIRAYNTKQFLKFKQTELMRYVENGGTLIVQYNTSRGLVTQDLGPYPLKLSRDRVSVEEAEVRILAPDHPVLNFPNKITNADFDNWVQERGLYFPGEWAEEYEAILSSNDPEESPKDGGLLVAEYGKGYFVYSGYSWFRELPAGVPGAFRIFANMLALGKEGRP